MSRERAAEHRDRDVPARTTSSLNGIRMWANFSRSAWPAPVRTIAARIATRTTCSALPTRLSSLRTLAENGHRRGSSASRADRAGGSGGREARPAAAPSRAPRACESRGSQRRRDDPASSSALSASAMSALPSATASDGAHPHRPRTPCPRVHLSPGNRRGTIAALSMNPTRNEQTPAASLRAFQVRDLVSLLLLRAELLAVLEDHVELLLRVERADELLVHLEGVLGELVDERRGDWTMVTPLRVIVVFASSFALRITLRSFFEPALLMFWTAFWSSAEIFFTTRARRPSRRCRSSSASRS